MPFLLDGPVTRREVESLEYFGLHPSRMPV
jgi:hypothetical protein